MVRSRILLLDEEQSDVELLQKALELRMFQVMTACNARALNARPTSDAAWLRTEADPTREIARLRKLGLEGPILVSADAPITTASAMDDGSPQKVLQIPFGLKVKDLEAHLVSALQIPARATRDPLGLGMNERVFMAVFDPAERHFLRELVAAHRADELTSAKRLMQVADIKDFHSRLSRLRTKAWLFGFKIETIGNMYALQLDF